MSLRIWFGIYFLINLLYCLFIWQMSTTKKKKWYQWIGERICPCPRLTKRFWHKYLCSKCSEEHSDNPSLNITATTLNPLLNHPNTTTTVNPKTTANNMSWTFEERLKRDHWVFTNAHDLKETIKKLMFDIAKHRSIECKLSNFDVSQITDMNGLFENFPFDTANKHKYDVDITGWDVSNVVRMDFMFCNSYGFNQPLNEWNVSNVKTMKSMFAFATVFNQPLDSWNVSNTINMDKMFFHAKSFNQPLDSWDVSNVRSMENMFSSAKSFNQSLESWKLPKLRKAKDATAFQQEVSSKLKRRMVVTRGGRKTRKRRKNGIGRRGGFK